MSSKSEVIETTVSEVAAELTRRGLDPDDRVTITIEPDELIPGRRASRARVIAAGLIDADLDRLVKQAQKEVEQRTGMRIVLDTNVLVSAALNSRSQYPASLPNSSMQRKRRSSGFWHIVQPLFRSEGRRSDQNRRSARA
jgi:hypothetical protein